MLKTIYTRAVKVLMKKPLALWGISLLSELLILAAGLLCGAVPILAIAVCMLLGTSMTMVYLHGYRGQEVKTTQLFDCFQDWATIKRVLAGMGWRALWIFLWALIPVVGIVFAVIRSYEYRLVPYILVTEPDVAPTEAIKVSKKRTQGYKGKMFLADFLVGIAYTVVSLVLGLFGQIPYVGVLFSIASFVISLAYSVLSPLFLGLVQAAFYEEIQNPTIPAVPVAPVVPVAPAAPAAPAEPIPQPEDVPTAKPISYCPNCGTPVYEGYTFCSNCGYKVG